MKKNEKNENYEVVTKLPTNALTVKAYCDKVDISTSYVYKQIKEGKAKFKIVVFQTINFVIPNKN